MRDTRIEALRTCLAMYCVLIGLLFFAQILGFPTKVAAPMVVWLSVACLLIFVVFGRMPPKDRVFAAIMALMFAIGSFSASPLWFVAFGFVILFRISPFWGHLK